MEKNAPINADVASNNDNSGTRRQPWNRFNVINTVAYVLNVFVNYAIGTGKLVDLPDIGETSNKYHTIVTPAGYAFSIWGPIFILQAFWMLWQWLPSQCNSQGVYAVGYKYLAVSLFQSAWVVAFGYEIMWLALLLMVALWGALYGIIAALQKYDKVWKGYFLWQFPFSLHFGWITAATAVNVNLVLVAYGASIEAQLVVAAATLVVLLFVALFFLLQFPVDLTIPAVLVWGLGAIYVELQNPKDSILERFSESQIRGIQYASLAGMAVILLGIVVKAVYVVVYERKQARKPSPNQHALEKQTNSNSDETSAV